MRKVKLSLVGLVIVAVVSFGISQTALAGKIYRPPEPPGRTAAFYIKGMLGLVGGEISIAVEHIGDGVWAYTVAIDVQPHGAVIDPEVLNELIMDIVGDPELREEGEKMRFIENSLFGIEEEITGIVGDLREEYLGALDRARRELEPSVRELLGVGDPEAELTVPQEGVLEAYVNKVKKGAWTEDLIWEIEDFKIPLKNTVASYLGLDFLDIVDPKQSGTLSYFAEWAISLYMLGADEECAQIEITERINARRALKDDVETQIFKGAEMNIFNPLESGIISYFADLKLNPGLTDAEIERRIVDFGTKIEDIRGNLRDAVSDYLGGTLDENILSRFAAITLGKSLSAHTEKILLDWVETVDDATADRVLFDPWSREERKEIKRDGLAQLTTYEIFDINREMELPENTISVIDWMTRLIGDMKFVKDVFEEKFGADTIDVGNLEHEKILMGYAAGIANSVDLAGKTHGAGMDVGDEGFEETARGIVRKAIMALEDDPFAELISYVPDMAPAAAILPSRASGDSEDVSGFQFAPPTLREGELGIGGGLW